MPLQFLAITAIVIFFAGYKFYARKFSETLGIEKDRKTPAHSEYDGVDYIPVKHWTVLFGHHFSSIAGAAPIVGPILALTIWGWAPVYVWVVLGTVFLGGIHDLGSLFISCRNKGKTIAEVSELVISKRARILFLSFVWITLIFIIAVFVNICAKTFIEKPAIVLPSLGLIPVAFLVGIGLYRTKTNNFLVTVFGLVAIVALIILGEKHPIAIGQNPILFWSIVLLIYSFFASVIPVNLLLQPRDYLSAFILVFGLVAGYIGIFITNETIKLPAFAASTNSGNGGMPLWPMLFVTVACGAISGFHSLVASGTTSKQIQSEVHFRRIGYGAMLAEGLVAVMALIVIIATFGKTDLQVITENYSIEVNPVILFGSGFQKITEKFMGNYGGSFAVLLLNAFILTTLDTAARIGRYITEELFKIKSKLLATLIVILVSAWLCLSGKWTVIWVMFGTSNQLIAAITLLIISSWLVMNGRKSHFTIYAMIFMIVTTIASFVWQLTEYLADKNYLLVIISCMLILLAVSVFWEGLQSFRKKGMRVCK